MDIEVYHALAELFVYPDAAFAERVATVQTLLDARQPAAATALTPFTAAVAVLEPREREELFTRSFDVQSLTTLDIGYVLFGDDYKRGELLAQLNREHAAAGVDCGHELGDHLPNLLKLLAAWGDGELCREFVAEIVQPALRKMLAEFDPARVERKGELYRKHYRTLIEAPAQATVYRCTLAAVWEVLAADFGVAKAPVLAATNDFIRVLDTELSVEPVISP